MGKSEWFARGKKLVKKGLSRERGIYSWNEEFTWNWAQWVIISKKWLN